MTRYLSQLRHGFCTDTARNGDSTNVSDLGFHRLSGRTNLGERTF